LIRHRRVQRDNLTPAPLSARPKLTTGWCIIDIVKPASVYYGFLAIARSARSHERTSCKKSPSRWSLWLPGRRGHAGRCVHVGFQNFMVLAVSRSSSRSYTTGRDPFPISQTRTFRALANELRVSSSGYVNARFGPTLLSLLALS
jgi:hypothetical protein